MKKTILALAAVLAVSGAYATGETTSGTGTSYSGGVRVGGSINNSVSTSASVTSAPGMSFSAAGMSSLASATATVTVPTTTTVDGTTTIAGGVSGSTVTSSSGYAYNIATGSGAGSAGITGTTSAFALGNLKMEALNCDPAEGILELDGEARSSTALTLATSGTNSGGWAGVESGSTFSATGKLSLTVLPNVATIGGSVEDVKNATSYAVSDAGAIEFEGGTPEGFVTVAPTVLTGNATSIVNAVGSFSGFKDISGGELPKCDTCGGGEDPEHPPKGDKGPKGNNGYGNGDQSAPGNSLPNNNAENGPNGKGKGKPEDTPQFNRNKD